MYQPSGASSGGDSIRRRGGQNQIGQNNQSSADSYVVPPSSSGSSSFSIGHAPSHAHEGLSRQVTDSMASNSSRDRTSEFMNTIRSFQGRQMNGGLGMTAHNQPSAAKAQLTAQSAQFMKIARSIGKDITNTYTKLEKLTLLARRKTLFDDRPQEIQELTYIIKEDMNMLNRQIGQLQQIAKAQRAAGLQGRHQQSHSSSVVVALQSKLAVMTSNFKEVLEVRTENLKETKSRSEQFSQGSVTSSLPQSALTGFHSGSVLAMEDDERASANGQVAISMGPQQALLSGDTTNEYLLSRADTMQNIESTIVELGGIFSQLAHMIKEQEEIMVRIDSNVEDAAMNVEAGHGEILKYFQSVTSNRWLMIKIFGVLIFFFIFFVIFMA